MAQPDPTTGMQEGGIPVVDLTASTRALLDEADRLRTDAVRLAVIIEHMQAHANRLDELVATLSGAPDGRS